MRLISVELNGFRAFARSEEFDLDADAVIVVATNGQGKTSMFDGILWCLSGQIPRLGSDARFVSLYSETGTSRVELRLRTNQGEQITIARSDDGKQQLLRVDIGGEVFRNELAKTRLLEILWPESLLTSDSAGSLTSALTRSVYLQQDLVRQFVEADSDSTRFNAVSELVGAGRVNELQVQLESAKNAWVRATNTRERDRDDLRVRMMQLESQLGALGRSGDDLESLTEEWSDWWSRARGLGIESGELVSPSSIDAPGSLDVTIKRIQALRQANSRRLDSIEELLRDVGQEEQVESLDVQRELRGAYDRAVADEDGARVALRDAEDRAARRRRTLVEQRAVHEELRALAQLALRHLGENCPVCEQMYDRKATELRLRQLAEAGAEELLTVTEPDEIATRAAALESAEKNRIDAEGEIQHREQLLRASEARRSDRERRFRDLRIVAHEPNESATASLNRVLSELTEAQAALATLQDAGERLGLALAQAGEHARKAEIENELQTARNELGQLDATLSVRNRTNALAAELLDRLREATSTVVNSQIERLDPLLQRIYATIDPHPTFRAAHLVSRFSNRRGRLTAGILDPYAGLESESPQTVLSSSQMNAFAVSIFLSLNLGLSSLPLDTAILDDPLQSLDDVNLLGLIDLLRRTKERRQLLVSTHDSRFGRLLSRKLRPIEGQGATRMIELEGWNPEGPLITQETVPPDTARLLLAG